MQVPNISHHHKVASFPTACGNSGIKGGNSIEYTVETVFPDFPNHYNDKLRILKSKFPKKERKTIILVEDFNIYSYNEAILSDQCTDTMTFMDPT